MAALNAEAAYVPNVRENPNYVFDEFSGQSEFAVPIVHRGEVLGVLDSEHPDIDGFSSSNRQIMQALTVLAAPHIAALLRRQEGTVPDYADVIADLTRLPAIAKGNLQGACATMTERAARTLRVTRANIWLFRDDDEDTLECIDNYELATNEHSHGETLAREALPNYFAALESERVIIASDAINDARTVELAEDYLQPHGIQSLLDAPIRMDGQVVGVLCLEAEGEPRKWNIDEAGFVGTLSDFATIALVTHQKSLAQSALIQSQKMESLGRLAGGISHDFNNLLTLISGAVETLQLNQDRNASDQKLLHRIAEAGDRARKLTRNLMAFGGNQHLQLEAINAADLIHKVQELTEGIIREDIRVEFEGLDDELWLRCDTTQLEQVLLNLISNAVDAMPDGGTLTISVKSIPDDGVCISVQDDGSGMSEAVKENIFEPFFTTKGDFGTGLGSSISLGIVQQHGGTLDCETVLGEGTRFDLTLPRTDAPLSKTKVHRSTPERHTTDVKPNVLLVEDEEGVRNVVSEMIKALGYEALVANDAANALEILDTSAVDLLLTDVIMPGMRGPELYRAA
jgi:nitrogen-specific signal transduction histidine kinase